jgi:hypothetical protein
MDPVPEIEEIDVEEDCSKGPTKPKALAKENQGADGQRQKDRAISAGPVRP